jgi:hypothetical protein
MKYVFIILGFFATVCAAFVTFGALVEKSTDIQLILGGVYWIAASVFFVGAGLIFRMDEHHSKKDTPQ